MTARHQTDGIWPHAPVHRLGSHGTYLVTCSTYNKQHFFNEVQRLDVLQRGLLSVAQEYGWQLEAWAVFSNHYHFIAHSTQTEENGNGASLPVMLNKLHSKTATWLNTLDSTPGRKVWHNYWDTRLTNLRSYLVRLNYVHHNAVKHGLVEVARLYPWCSAGWFEETASRTQVAKVYSLKWDRVGVADEHHPLDLPALGWR